MTAVSDQSAALLEVERKLWAAADELRANSTLTAAQYRDPVLGLIFLAFAEHRFERAAARARGEGDRAPAGDAPTTTGPAACSSSPRSRGSRGSSTWRREDLGANIDLAMDAIESINTDLATSSRAATQKLEKIDVVELRPPVRAAAAHAVGRRLRADLRVLPRQVRRRPRAGSAASSSRRSRSCG